MGYIYAFKIIIYIIKLPSSILKDEKIKTFRQIIFNSQLTTEDVNLIDEILRSKII